MEEILNLTQLYICQFSIVGLFKLNVINIFWPVAVTDASRATAVAATGAETGANLVTAAVATTATSATTATAATAVGATAADTRANVVTTAVATAEAVTTAVVTRVAETTAV